MGFGKEQTGRNRRVRLAFIGRGAYPARLRGRCRTSIQANPMSDTPPDRLSTDPRSPHHHAEILSRGVGIRFRGEEKTNVEEYCISEGWVRLPVGRSLDRRGNPMTLKVKGDVVAYFLDEKKDEDAG